MSKSQPMAVHYASRSAEHYTPLHIIERCVVAMGAIDLDPCADPEGTVPARRHFTTDDDGLAQIWSRRIYINPPYGRAISQWVDKFVESYVVGDMAEGIALVPARPDTKWWRQFRDCTVCFVHGRLKFVGNTNSAPFPSALINIGEDHAAFRSASNGLGDVWARIGA